MNKARIIQFTPSISFGDAVSNDIIAMSEVLTEMGYENYIVAIGIAPKVRRRAVPLDSFKPRKTDVFIYHMSIGSMLSDYIMSNAAAVKIMVYHNITPPHFWGNMEALKQMCIDGRTQLRQLVPHISLAICDSEYNREELLGLGYKNTVVLPIMFDREEYARVVPSQKILRKYSDGVTNILFVGRIAPNKRQEDIIRSFACYNRSINANSRLLLVGTALGMESYKAAIEEFVSEHAIPNVIFSGHVSFSDIAAYYRTASVFLCESEHEGFCVPLLEAMCFDVPIVAYAVCAVDGTLGSSGLKFYEKDHRLIAELINSLETNAELREDVLISQRKRLEDFDIAKTRVDFCGIIKAVMENIG